MQLLLDTEDESVLIEIEEIFLKEKADWWNELSEEEQMEIQEGLKQADNGQTIRNEEVMKSFNKWH